MATNKRINPYPKDDGLIGFIYGLADSSLILAQRLSELCGHGPSLELDMGMTNIALDLFGQVRSYYQYAAKKIGGETTEDDLAFFRTEREFRSVLLVEQPNTDFAYVMARQFLYDHYHYLMLQKLQQSEDGMLASIARKSVKEVEYHREYSSGWIRRFGDGTGESHERIQKAIDDLWVYTDELFHKMPADKNMINEGIGVDFEAFKEEYYKNVEEVLEEATLKVPESKYFQKGGKNGVHTEHMGHLLTEMQYMQRTYPGMEW